jgi:HSP20 family protein
MNALFEGFERRRVREFPSLNVWKGKEDSIVTAELPGVDPKDLDISVRGNALTIRGSRELDRLKEGEAYHRVERAYGQFVRSVQLTHEVAANKVDASYRKGILRIKLPVAEADKPKKIAITGGS